MSKEKEVRFKWKAEEDTIVIYRIDRMLIFYKKQKDPEFFKEQKVSPKEIDKSNPYKSVKFNVGELPQDAHVDLLFSWCS